MPTELGESRGAADSVFHGHVKNRHRAEKQLAAVPEDDQENRQPRAVNGKALRTVATAAAQGGPHRQPGAAYARRRVPK